MNKKLLLILMPILMQATVKEDASSILKHLNPKDFAELQATAVAFVSAASRNEVRNLVDKSGRQIAARLCDKTLVDNKVSTALFGGKVSTQDAAALVARALINGAVTQAQQGDAGVAAYGKSFGKHALAQLTYNQLKLRLAQAVALLGFTPVENLHLHKTAERIFLDVAEGLSYDLVYAGIEQALSRTP